MDDSLASLDLVGNAVDFAHEPTNQSLLASIAQNDENIKNLVYRLEFFERITRESGWALADVQASDHRIYLIDFSLVYEFVQDGFSKGNGVFLEYLFFHSKHGFALPIGAMIELRRLLQRAAELNARFTPESLESADSADIERVREIAGTNYLNRPSRRQNTTSADEIERAIKRLTGSLQRLAFLLGHRLRTEIDQQFDDDDEQAFLNYLDEVRPTRGRNNLPDARNLAILLQRARTASSDSNAPYPVLVTGTGDILRIANPDLYIGPTEPVSRIREHVAARLPSPPTGSRRVSFACCSPQDVVSSEASSVLMVRADDTRLQRYHEQYDQMLSIAKAWLNARDNGRLNTASNLFHQQVVLFQEASKAIWKLNQRNRSESLLPAMTLDASADATQTAIDQQTKPAEPAQRGSRTPDAVSEPGRARTTFLTTLRDIYNVLETSPQFDYRLAWEGERVLGDSFRTKTFRIEQRRGRYADAPVLSGFLHSQRSDPTASFIDTVLEVQWPVICTADEFVASFRSLARPSRESASPEPEVQFSKTDHSATFDRQCIAVETAKGVFAAPIAMLFNGQLSEEPILPTIAQEINELYSTEPLTSKLIRKLRINAGSGQWTLDVVNEASAVHRFVTFSTDRRVFAHIAAMFHRTAAIPSSVEPLAAELAKTTTGLREGSENEENGLST